MMYIALICKEDNLGAMVKHPVALTGGNKKELIAKAIQLRGEMQNDIDGSLARGGNRYEIYLGTLTQTIQVPISYEVVPLTA